MEKVGAYTDRATETGEWRAGNPGLGLQATPMLAVYFNMLQRELVGVLEAAGFDPDVNDDAQLAKAIRAIGGSRVLTITQSTVLVPNQLGLILVNAQAGALTVSLPPAAPGLRVVLRRIDSTSNAAIVATSGADKLLIDTTANAAGQASTELLFTGDYLAFHAADNGRWMCIGQAQLPGSIATGLVVYSAPGSSSFTVPAVLRSGRRVPTVTAVGAGGAGGSGQSVGRGAGGGAGGCAKKRIALAAITSVAVTVGAAGKVGATTGGTTSFGTYCSATGGLGGQNYSGGPCAGGAPGLGVGGDLNISGGYGSDAPMQSGSYYGGSGDGGPSVMGGGVRSSDDAGIAVKAAPGSGGGGSLTAVSPGLHGILIIEW